LRYEDVEAADPFMLEVLEHLARRVDRHELYLVGGYLRDFLLGINARDADFVTRLSPRELAADTASRFGGKMVALKEGEGIYRAALRRQRRLYTIDFSAIKGMSLEDDLSARDFTINAMALDVWTFALQREAILPRDLVDKHYGWRDLKNRLLRECGKEAFRIDPVRVLRAARFMHAMGMRPEGRTLNHMKKYASLLSRAPGERVAVEVLEILSLPGASQIFDRLQEEGILHHIFPALDRMVGLPQNTYHHLDAWRHTLATLDELDRLMEHPEKTYPRHAVSIREHMGRRIQGPYQRSAMLRLAALFHDSGKTATWSRDDSGRIHFHGHARFSVEEMNAAARRLCLSRRSADYLEKLVERHMDLASLQKAGGSQRGLYRMLQRSGEELIDLVVLSTADRLATRGEASTPRELEGFIALGDALLELGERNAVLPPLLTGRELCLELGVEEGPVVGDLLRELREAQVTGKIASRQEALELARGALEERRGNGHGGG
jgi:poly(A) polymerase